VGFLRELERLDRTDAQDCRAQLVSRRSALDRFVSKAFSKAPGGARRRRRVPWCPGAG
jgi:hypothetical protein